MNNKMREPEASKRYHRVLTIAGSDSGGGAGIQADLKTVAALGCYGMSAITALTAQNTKGVTGIHPVPPAFVAEQIDAVLSDIGADAVKIGMLYSPELIETVARTLQRYQIDRIVLDPVMVAQSGDKLLQADAVDALKTCLMPLATVATPNLPEAAVLLNRPIRTPADMRVAMPDLMRLGSRNMLLKGGHDAGESSTDLLCLGDEERLVPLEAERIPTRNNHGTGCTLSSAVAAGLAKGLTAEAAVRAAKDYITDAIRFGAEYRLGEGHGPVHHFGHQWTEPVSSDL